MRSLLGYPRQATTRSKTRTTRSADKQVVATASENRIASCTSGDRVVVGATVERKPDQARSRAGPIHVVDRSCRMTGLNHAPNAAQWSGAGPIAEADPASLDAAAFDAAVFDAIVVGGGAVGSLLAARAFSAAVSALRLASSLAS